MGITPTDTVTYTYGDSEWGDLLSAYNGNAITYDQIGNPLTDGTWTYTWEHGRELASMSNGNTTWTYTYNAAGLRTKRTNGTDTYTYVYNDGKLSQMTVGNDVLRFVYDAMGNPMTVYYNGTAYYYVVNIQGDVIQIVDEDCNIVVRYGYDAWGNINGTTGSMAETLGALNPLRYRGYVYDTETELYYLQSRYYNPEIGRFINADNRISGVGGSILGYNMFAYCMNNSVNMLDNNGDWPTWSNFISSAKKAVDVIVQTVVTLSSPVISTVIKELHYNRNVLNDTNYTEKELVEQGYIKEDTDSDKFHQNNKKNDERNRKYVIGDWFSSEIVYYSDGTINTTPEDEGTFNVYSGDNIALNIIIHVSFDVIPYMIWGNSEDDSTTLVDRIIMIGE